MGYVFWVQDYLRRQLHWKGSQIFVVIWRRSLNVRWNFTRDTWLEASTRPFQESSLQLTQPFETHLPWLHILTLKNTFSFNHTCKPGDVLISFSFLFSTFLDLSFMDFCSNPTSVPLTLRSQFENKICQTPIWSSQLPRVWVSPFILVSSKLTSQPWYPP